MFIGDGAKLVRDAFQLAKEKSPAIIFIDELDAIGTKRFDSEKAGDREVQRTMLELLNQLDGFQVSCGWLLGWLLGWGECVFAAVTTTCRSFLCSRTTTSK